MRKNGDMVVVRIGNDKFIGQIRGRSLGCAHRNVRPFYDVHYSVSGSDKKLIEFKVYEEQLEDYQPEYISAPCSHAAQILCYGGRA